MLALQGIPAVYIHSLLATPNDLRGVELSGRTRSINRKKWNLQELEILLENETTPNHEVYNALNKLLKIRRHEPCFNPSNPQRAIDGGYALFMLLRSDIHSERRLLAIHNTTLAPQTVHINNDPELEKSTGWYDLISSSELETGLSELVLQPYQFIWLVADQPGITT
jgi:sucrose phosphorylase